MKNEIEQIIVNHINRKISLGEATTQIMRLFAIMQQREQSSKNVDGKCMLCGDDPDTKDGWICKDCRKF